MLHKSNTLALPKQLLTIYT